MASDRESSDILGLSEIQEDGEKSAALTALIITAARENDAKHTLREIYQAISKSGSSHLLDPLDAIPVLVPTNDIAARDIMALMGDCCSAKEVIVAVQESIERIQTNISAELDDGAEEGREASPAIQLDVLISLYMTAIPRLKLRNKSAPDTIGPLMTDLESALRALPTSTVPSEGRGLIITICSAIEEIYKWATRCCEGHAGDALECQDVLHSLLETTVVACVPFVNASLAPTAFATLSPRMASRTTIHPGREESEQAMKNAIQTTILLGYGLPRIRSTPSLATLVLLAHNPVPLSLPSSWLTSFIPIILTSVQTNVALDETLAILFHQLSHTTDLPLEVLAPLADVLPSLASIHPDPSIRFMTFRLLALLLTVAPPPIHFQILRDLTSESAFPQMRSAAVGLVKEAVIEGLNKPVGSSMFASPQFMRTFAPILFRPHSPHLFSPGLSPEEFKDSSEPSRLAESLALLYVLLQRDKENRTGVRDVNAISTIEADLLSPLRSLLSLFKAANEHDHDHDDMALASLEMNLERVDSVIASSHAAKSR